MGGVLITLAALSGDQLECDVVFPRVCVVTWFTISNACAFLCVTATHSHDSPAWHRVPSLLLLLILVICFVFMRNGTSCLEVTEGSEQQEMRASGSFIPTTPNHPHIVLLRQSVFMRQ